MKVAGLCPLFSLLASCLRSPKSDMSMESVSATLGAAIIIADSHTIGEMKKRSGTALSVSSVILRCALQRIRCAFVGREDL